MATDVTVSALHKMMYAGGSLSWFTMLEWMQAQEIRRQAPLGYLRMLGRGRRLARGTRTLPERHADRAVTGHTVDYFQRWLDNSGPDPEYWEGRRFDRDLQDVTVPVSMVGGWYDFMLPFQMQDYAALRAAGRQPELTIGPWTHATPAGLGAGVEHGIRWLRHHLHGDTSQARDLPVRIFVTGAEEWRDLPDWPPPSAVSQRWHLHSGERLDVAAPAAGSEPDSHRYDPADPTPALGGPIGLAEKVLFDNAPLEARDDVLVYTSPPLESDLDVVGVPVVELFISADIEHLDVFARLCDVGLDGVSTNVCDALLRVTAERPVRVELWPTAHRFLAGHRLRLQVSGGAFPRYPRNRGTADPYSPAVELVPSTRRILHDPDHPSALVLPVTP
jgi:putative CocE/NonD family hydrolase